MKENLEAIRDRPAIAPATQALERIRMLDIFAQEMDCAIDEQEVTTADMLGSEAPRVIPIVRVYASGIGRIFGIGARRKVIDLRDS